MTHKKKDPKASGMPTLRVVAKPDESKEETLARLAVEPCMTAAILSTSFPHGFGDLDLTAAHAALLEQTKRVHAGNMQEVESALVAQATALNSIFAELARRAAMNMGEYMGAMETYMKLALRAQNQSRMALETLATIKNPPVVFAKQANIAHGHQQVNNGDTASRAQETEKPQPELLEAPHAKPDWLDTGAAQTAASSHKHMEAMGTVHRAKDRSRKGKSKP